MFSVNLLDQVIAGYLRHSNAVINGDECPSPGNAGKL